MDERTGWIPVEVRSPRQRIANAIFTISPAAGFFVLAFSTVLIFLPDLSFGFQILAGLVAMAVAFGVAVLIVALLNSAPNVNLDRGLMRVGGRTIGLAEIDTAAVVVVQSSRKHRSVGIRFGKEKGLMTMVILRHDDRIVLGRAETDRLVALLERTSIRMPTDQYDPKGKFARYNFPANVERDVALELVRNPPGPSDALPIPEDGRYPRT